MKKIVVLLFLILLISIVLPISSAIYAVEDVYDVILFWGQSNMTGYANCKEWGTDEDPIVNLKNASAFRIFS